MSKRASSAGILLAALLAGISCIFAAQDGLKLLEDDDSSVATKKISDIYLHTANKDQRFWLIQALGIRLRERRDASALEALLKFSRDFDPYLRSSALRAMAGFSSLPPESIRANWLARMDAAAAVGIRDRAGSVRDGAADLKRVLELWRVSASQEGLRSVSPELVRRPFRFAAILRWAWVFFLPMVALVWSLAGLPVFNQASASGRLAHSLWPVLRGEGLSVGLAALFWSGLAMILAGGLFDLRTYFTAGFCFFTPGALLSAKLCSAPGTRGLLRDLASGILISLGIFGVLLPMEIFYRLFFRKGDHKEDRQVLRWILDTGSLRTGYLACALMAREGHGLLPAWRRAMRLFSGRRQASLLDLGAYDTRFTLACALSALFLSLPAARLPVEWNTPSLVGLLACALWAWSMLAVLLAAVLQALEGIGSAASLLLALERRLPPKFPQDMLGGR